MDVRQVFLSADQALSGVIGKIKPNQWEITMPAWFQTGRTDTNPTLRDIVNYHAYDEAWVPDTLAGATIEGVGKKYDGDLLGTNPASAYAHLAELAAAAVGASDLDAFVHLTYGDFPVREYLRHIISFRGFRAYDIARLIGAQTALPDELVSGMWELLSPDMDEWRKLGVYPPAVTVPPASSLQDRLIAASGRDPHVAL